MKRISISAVSYLNTKPFIQGIFEMGLDKLVDLSLDIPSVCAQKLKAGVVDLGLIPVAVIPELPTPHIISDYCIGTEGEVKTVSIFAERPIHELKRVYLDYQSRTSVQLARYLMREYWQKDIEFIPAHVGYESEIGGDTAGLIIGDRAINLEANFPFVYDLGKAWRDFTDLPFVFAAWVSNERLPTEFIEQFNCALETGIRQIKQVADKLQGSYPTFNVLDYFTKYISYSMDLKKKEALSLFLEELTRNKEGMRKPIFI